MKMGYKQRIIHIIMKCSEHTLQNPQQHVDFTQQDIQEPLCHFIVPTIINKITMHSFVAKDLKLKNIPDVPQKTQKLDLSFNMIQQLETGLFYLKQINMEMNLIFRIPQNINDLHLLTTLKLNNNCIRVIPFLKYVRHLQLQNNPIKLITSRIRETRLQFLSFDWLIFLVFNIYGNDVVSNLSDIILSAQLSCQDEFLTFQNLFQNRKSQYPNIICSTHKAIQKKMDFFIDYLKQKQKETNFNCLEYNGKLLLEDCLQNNYEKALALFKGKRSSIQSDAIYIKNLILACKYAHLQYFNYVIGNGLRRRIILQNQEEIIQTIIQNFSQENSPQILQKIMSICNFNSQNKKIFYLPINYTLASADKICQAINFILQNQSICQLFDFEYSVKEATQEPLLHFAMLNRNPQLALLVLQKFDCPFVLDSVGKTAKRIRGSVFSRKLVWKYQKKHIKMFMNQQNAKSASPKAKSSFSVIENTSGRKLSSSFHVPLIKHKNKAKMIEMSPFLKERSFHTRSVIEQLKIKRMKDINQFSQESLMSEAKFCVDQFDSENYNITFSYEKFQKSLLKKVSKDYKCYSKKKEDLSNWSPLRICQQIETEQNSECQTYFQKNKLYSMRSY